MNLILISLSLAMDAFSISIIKGLTINKVYKAFIISFYFGLFQFLMTYLGYNIGIFFNKNILNYGKYITFFILFLIGINMILDSKKEIKLNSDIKIKEMIILSILTSIDAFSVGITFSFSIENIIINSVIIGIITYILSLIGVIIGKKLYKIVNNKATFIGGIIMLILSIKVLFF